MDAAGNICVTGSFERTVDFSGTSLTSNGNVEDIFVACYDATGVLRWAQRFGGAGADWGTSIALDPGGDVYVGGGIGGDTMIGSTLIQHLGNYDGFLTRLDGASGSVRWATGVHSTGSDIVWSVATGGGIVSAAGQAGNNVDFGGGPETTRDIQDGFVARYQAVDGGYLSAVVFLGDGVLDRALATVVDDVGNVYTGARYGSSVTVLGHTIPAANYNGLVLSLDEDGAYAWAVALETPYFDEVMALALGGDTLYATGETMFSASASRGFVTARDAKTGANRWPDFQYLNSGATATPLALCTTGDRYFLAGRFEGQISWGSDLATSAGGIDIFLANGMSLDGTPVSPQTWGNNREEVAYGLACNASGRLAMVGRAQTALTFGSQAIPFGGSDDGFIVVFSP
ncbi:MAG: hypothetical protein JRH20_27030 [Deltaproteobacteria bacterium]|nr:hypothetical protein [Deltaproteobacteria bacterium]